MKLEKNETGCAGRRPGLEYVIHGEPDSQRPDATDTTTRLRLARVRRRFRLSPLVAATIADLAYGEVAHG